MNLHTALQAPVLYVILVVMLWTIKRTVSKGAYVYAVIPIHPKATARGYVLHHRALVECYLGRELLASEVVHHIDGDSKNNRLDNLALMERSAHVRWHAAQRGSKKARMLCLVCKKEFIRCLRDTHLRSTTGRWFTCCSKSCGTRFSYQHRENRNAKNVVRAVERSVVEIFSETKLVNPPSILEAHKTKERLEDLWSLCEINYVPSEPTYIVKNCLLCSRQFKTTRHSAKFCSHTCAAENTRKVKRPTPEELKDLVWKHPTTQLAQQFGVSDVAVAKWCRRYGIEKPPRGYWTKQQNK